MFYGFLAIAAAALVITTAASIVPTQTASTSNVTQSELSALPVNVKELLSISPEYEYVLLSSAHDGQAEGCVCLRQRNNSGIQV